MMWPWNSKIGSTIFFAPLDKALMAETTSGVIGRDLHLSHLMIFSDLREKKRREDEWLRKEGYERVVERERRLRRSRKREEGRRGASPLGRLRINTALARYRDATHLLPVLVFQRHAIINVSCLFDHRHGKVCQLKIIDQEYPAWNHYFGSYSVIHL